MNNPHKKYMIYAAISFVVAFTLIFAAMFLTGGREDYEFTSTDKVITAIFLPLVGVSLVFGIVFTFIFTMRTSKMNLQITYNAMIEQYNARPVLRRLDRLSAEEFPEGMLEEILSFIKSAEDGTIDKIYAVRKAVTYEYFASVFVIKFADGTETWIKDKIMQKIKAYFDTYDYAHPLSLFSYEEVASVKVERIKNSCVYSKK